MVEFTAKMVNSFSGASSLILRFRDVDSIGALRNK